MKTLLTDMIARKRQRRKELAALPVCEKLRMLEQIIADTKGIAAPIHPSLPIPSSSKSAALRCCIHQTQAGCANNQNQMPRLMTAKNRITQLLMILLAMWPALLPAQSSMMELRKKMQSRHAAAAKGYQQQMEEALQRGDLEGADKALKAAIAQGTMTQTQIDEARSRIQAVESSQRAEMVAAAQNQEQATQARETATNASSASSSASAAPGVGMTHLKFEGNGIHSVRLFNVTASGAESTRKTEVSPGDCTRGGKAAEANNDTTIWLMVYVADDGKGVAGTYGYEMKFQEVVNRSFPLATPKIGRTRTFKGTISIPPGKSDGVISVDRFNWNGGAPDIRVRFP